MTLGIPPLLSKVTNVANTALLLVSDAKIILNLLGLTGPKWGIYYTQYFVGGGGVKALEPDSVVSLDFKNESIISNYPIEKGSFGTYNKVSVPYNARVRMTKGGTQAERQKFLDDLESILHDRKLLLVVSPERTYENANIICYDYARSSSNGAGLITVDVTLMEVRLSATSALSNTQTVAPSGSFPKSGGTISPIPTGLVPGAQ